MISTIQYFKDVATANQKLSKEEQIELFKRYKDESLSDRERTKARNALVSSTYALCLRVVTKLKSDHMLSQEEMLHWCVIAQHKALELYDPSFGTSFSSYLHNRLISILITNLKQLRVVALPSYVPLRESIIRVSMTGAESEFDFSEEEAEKTYDLPGNKPTKRVKKNKTKYVPKIKGQISLDFGQANTKNVEAKV